MQSWKGKDVQHMCSIFRWLRERHVKSILQVTMIDNQEPPHSDQAIQACLRQLDVPVWNWYKPDLCSEVNFNVPPRVREVTRYSSRNNVVVSRLGSPNLKS
ncbi:hypothetical protein BBP40_009452 [Aspergillus hancockii]|nr:hypothetical protein BBP40_009452 [Aspergillus hancockii]